MANIFVRTVRQALRNFLNSEQSQIVTRVFSENFNQYRDRYLVAIGLMILASAATGATAWLMKDVINSILVSNEFSKILAIGLIVIGVFTAKGLATYAYSVTLAKIRNSLIASVQMRVFNHLLLAKVEYFDKTSIGEIFVRASAGVRATSKLVELLVMTVCRDIFSLFFLALVMIVQAPVLSLGLLVVGPLSYVFIRNIVRKTRFQVEHQLGDSSIFNSLMKETISGITMIKTYLLGREMEQRMGQVVDRLKTRNNRISKLGARTSPIMETLGGLAIGGLVIYAGFWITSPKTEFTDPEYPGKLMSFLTALLLAYAPARKLAQLRVGLERYYVNVRFMYDLLDHQKPELERFTNENVIENPKGDVRFDGVSFNYNPNISTLRNVSFHAKPGEKIGFVGPSGSGKSTIFKLMMALYQPEAGVVEIDGTDIFTTNPQSARSAISYVGQEAHIFTGSVLENIRFGNVQASLEQVQEAAKLAHAHEFIEGLSEGYETFVGEGGVQLSGGQRQRIVIARAFLKNAPIILLDEATSSLDSESEKAIQAALDELVVGKTTFIIAHRLSTVQQCDRIYVVSDGTILEQGSHEKLIKDDRLYAQLFKLQFAQ